MSDNDIVGRSWCFHELHLACFLGIEREIGLAHIMLYPVDPNHHNRLSMALRLLVPLSSTLLEYDRLGTLRLLLDCGVDSRVLHLWAPYRRIVDRANHEDIVETDLRTDLERELLDPQAVIVEHFGLLSTDAHDGEDLVRVRWQADTFLRAVDVDDGVLAGDGLPFRLPRLPLLLLLLLLGQWHLPSALDFRILWL